MIGSVFLAMLFSMEDVMANKGASEVLLENELVCELVEMENGDTEWSCSFVQVTEGLDLSVMGTGAGATKTSVYLFCYEHYRNGMPTGEIIAIRAPVS